MSDLELTVKQASIELGIAARTVRDWVQRGKLIGRMVAGRRGNEWRISADSVAKQAADKVAGGGGKAAVDIGRDGGGDYGLLIAEVRSLREDNAQYREHLERLTIAVGQLQETMTRLLPPAPEEQKPGLLTRAWNWLQGGEERGN